MLRSPYGGVEDVQAMANAGMEYVALNIGDYDSTEWSVVCNRAAQAGVKFFPKARVYSDLKVRQLVTVARYWDASAIIVNLETEAKTYMPPSLVRELLDAEGWDGEVGVSTEAHLYDYPAVSWVPLTGPKYVAMLQCYCEDSRVPQDKEIVAAWIAQCVRHARASGYTYVGTTLQCWRIDPDVYDRRGTYSLAYGDDVPGTGGWDAWTPQ